MKKLIKRIVYSIREALNRYPELYPLNNIEKNITAEDIYFNYEQNINEINKILKLKKIKYFNFTQPFNGSGKRVESIFDYNSQLHLLRIKSKNGNNFKELLNKFYILLDKKKIENTTNLKNIFDEDESEIFLDNIHLSNIGYNKISKIIASKIIENE